MYPQEERTRIGDLRCGRGFKAGSTNWGVIHPWVAVKTTGVERPTQKEDEVQEKRVRGRALENPDTEGPHIRHESKRRGVYSSAQSVQFSCSVVSNSLWPHGLQHTRLPCPSPTPQPTQTYVHGIGDAIQPSHPLSPPSSPAFNLS